MARSALQIEKAKSIIIVGGGAVGVELAGEIIYKYPMKKITIVHSHDRLIERLDSSVGKKALKWLEERGVKASLLLQSRLIRVLDCFFFQCLFNERAVSMVAPNSPNVPRADGAAEVEETVTLKLSSGGEVQGNMVCWYALSLGLAFFLIGE